MQVDQKRDDLCAHKKDEPSTVNQLLSNIQALQDKVRALNENRIFTIRRQRAALESPTSPVNLREFRVPEECKVDRGSSMARNHSKM